MDIGVMDRRCVRGALACGATIKTVVEDGFDKAIGVRAVFGGVSRGGFKLLRSMGASEPGDSKAASEALFGAGVRVLIRGICYKAQNS
jgi:hypothetical protein